jgi:hypothetical protein
MMLTTQQEQVVESGTTTDSGIDNEDVLARKLRGIVWVNSPPRSSVGGKDAVEAFVCTPSALVKQALREHPRSFSLWHDEHVSAWSRVEKQLRKRPDNSCGGGSVIQHSRHVNERNVVGSALDTVMLACFCPLNDFPKLR